MKRLFLLPLLVFFLQSNAQVETEEQGPKTIRSTFDDMLNASNRYQDFKVVKRVKLDAFMREVQDSLDVLQKKFNDEAKTTASLESQINQLNATIQERESNIQALEGQRDGISSMGMSFNKKTFSTAMWVAVLALLGLLVVVFLRNKSISMSHKAIKANLRDLEDELTATKKKALEREQELKREIQDYVNKLEAMGPPR